jgi:hypothetical protein
VVSAALRRLRGSPANAGFCPTTNPRRIFEENALNELTETVRDKGVLSPLLVRPLSERGFEIVFGARRYRAAQMADVATVPVRNKNLTDAEVLEAQLIELFIVGKSFICLYATSARRLYVIDVPGLPHCWIQRNAAAPCNGMRSLIAASVHW